jgi:hypothetical protein
MGDLIERVKLNLLVYGNGIEENFKNNSMFFADKYSKSDKLVKAISRAEIKPGRFHFFHYLDDSNWMRYSPVFVVDYKKFDGNTIVFAINLNFIPLEVRAMIFDPYMNIDHFEKGIPIKVDYKRAYEELFRVGFEYSLMEFNARQIKMAHAIDMELVPRFLYAQHPKATYDPKKLMSIWQKKIETKTQRDNEMKQAMLDDFYKIDLDISEKYKVMRDHISRMQRSMERYGRK